MSSPHGDDWSEERARWDEQRVEEEGVSHTLVGHDD